MEKIINLNLPEFAFVDSSGHDGDILKNRNVIIHTRTASIIEICESDKVFFLKDVITFNFINTNSLGTKEKMTALLHYSATLDKNSDKQEIIERVLVPTAKWFCDYCDWEDRNILGSE